MSLKLQNILLKLANDVLDLEKSGKTLGEPIDEAEKAILDLLDKSLPEAHDTSWVGKELVEPEVPIDLVTDIIGIYGEKLWHEGYNQALADVRKVIKEEL